MITLCPGLLICPKIGCCMTIRQAEGRGNEAGPNMQQPLVIQQQLVVQQQQPPMMMMPPQQQQPPMMMMPPQQQQQYQQQYQQQPMMQQPLQPGMMDRGDPYAAAS